MINSQSIGGAVLETLSPYYWRARSSVRPVETVELAGVPVRYRADCHAVHRQFNSLGHGEGALLSLVMDRLAPGETVVDVGAHVGLWTVPLALAGATVEAVEPAPEARVRLSDHAVLNGVRDRVHIYPVAAGAKRSEDKISMPVSDWFESDLTRTYVYPLDELAIEEPAHAKIDVEGAELDVLVGGRETLRTCRTVVVEVHPEGASNLYPDRGVAVDDVRDELERQGFRVEYWKPRPRETHLVGLRP